MKLCIKCNIEKENFYTENSNICKDCKKEYSKKYYVTNNEQVKEYRSKNSEKIKEYNIKYLKNNRENNSENLSRYRKEYRENNIDKFLEIEKEYRENNKDYRKKYDKEYREKNKEILNFKRKEKIKNNTLFKSKEKIRILIANSIKKMGYSKNSRTHEILGCSFEYFKEYIESLFTDGMSWENHGEWHLDHKIPISWSQTEGDLIRLNHYTNFQPLWKQDNLSKGHRWSD